MTDDDPLKALLAKCRASNDTTILSSAGSLSKMDVNCADCFDAAFMEIQCFNSPEGSSCHG